MKTMTPSRKKFLLNLGIAIGVVVFLFVLNIVLARDVTKRLEILKGLREENAFRTDAIETLVALERESAKALRYRSALSSVLPSEDSVITFQRDLRNLSKDHTLTAFTFSFGAEQTGTNGAPGSLAFQFTARGLFPDLIAFLETMEKDLYVTAIDSLAITFGQRDVNANVKGRVFFH